MIARRSWVLACAAAFLGASLAPAGAQSACAGGETDRTVRRDALNVAATHAAIRLDARLSEAIWAATDSLVDFRQREPLEGAPATERTVVKAVRDADALYIAVRACDRQPEAIRAVQLRRDADLSSDDNVAILIDSFHDRRSAFLFATNPNGAMWDAQFSGVDNLNTDWNGIWNVAVSRDSTGWIAEFRIPFRTLRFAAGTNVAFGFNVRRFIRRRNEETLWRGWGRTQGLYHLIAEGDLVGLGALERPHHLTVVPYVLGRAVAAGHDSTGTQVSDGLLGAKGGIDAKAALSPTLTADLTVNTDFAQVEADRQVINLTRFPLFFPEKREFFLESSGIFAFGSEGRSQLFYSRRIGLDTLGEAVPILGGVRVTGRVGPLAIGVLDARTGATDDANDVVVRVKHDVLERSYVGAMFLNRSGPGVGANQRSGGLDVDLPLVVHGYNLEPSFWIAGTQNPSPAASRGSPGTPLAWRYGTDFPNDLFDNFVSLYRIDSAFAPPLGFIRRSGIWETTGHIDYMPRPHVLGIRRLDFEAPIPSWDIIANESASPRTIGDSRTWQTATFNWQLLGGTLQSGDVFAASVQRLFDAPTDSFALFRTISVAAGRYWWTRGELQFQMSAGRPLSVGVDVNWGGFYGGRTTQARLSGTWRGGGHLVAGADLTRTEARLPNGRFVAVQTAGRIEYAFDTRTDFLGFVQFNNEEQRVDFNVRFHWIPQIGDDLYVVWNSGYTTDAHSPYPFPDRRSLSRPLNGALVIKAAHRVPL